MLKCQTNCWNWASRWHKIWCLLAQLFHDEWWIQKNRVGNKQKNKYLGQLYFNMKKGIFNNALMFLKKIYWMITFVHSFFLIHQENRNYKVRNYENTDNVLPVYQTKWLVRPLFSIIKRKKKKEKMEGVLKMFWALLV